MSLKKGAMYVFIANVINLIISLFTGFVLPKYLSIETYSSIKLFQLYITYIGILHLGFSDGMYLKYGGKTVEEVDKKEVLAEFKTFKIFQLIVAILAIIVSIIIKNEILLFCALVILPINVANYIRSLYQATGQFKKYSRFTNLNTLLIFFINVILLLIIKSDNSNTYIIAYIIAYIVYWLMLERENRKIFGKVPVKADKKYFLEDIKSGFFLMIGNFCNVIFTSIDRIFVQNWLGSIKFAFYSFAVSIENLMNVFVTPISTVMYNYFCNNRSQDDVIRIKKVILLFSTIVIVVVFPAKFIIDIWLTKYSEALNVLFILFVAQYISIVIRCVHINLYKAERKQNRYFKIMASVVVLSVVLNIVLYQIYHSMEMIAVATLITNIIWFIIGELDFKQYKLKLKEYIYLFLIMGIFLVCSQISNAITGCVIYVMLALLFMVIFMNKTFISCLKEGIGYIKRAISRIRK